jgi:hypothetical protein
LAAELRKDESLPDDEPELKDGIDSVKLESRLDTLCTVRPIEDWMEGSDLGTRVGSSAYEYACTTKPGPGVLSSLLHSCILEQIS